MPKPAASRFLLVHALLVPGALALAATLARQSGIDRSVADFFFDAARGGFPAHDWTWLELIGHRIAKSAAWAVWLAVLAAAFASLRVDRLAAYRGVLWTTVVAMAAGPLIVVGLKNINAHPCPWDLKQYGGFADDAAAWFVPAAQAGRCFPSGHAAGGFSMLALYFAGYAANDRRLMHAGLAIGLAAGFLFSAVRIAQGAHFVSHNLWSAAVVWFAAALVFAPLVMAQERAR
ncbi:MAG: phosphatase PAP2 family protein [Burkholderiaceae bacterium]|nr:phosphatase PAP2 family protein [Burkholderiaceae bacterium]